ncbi:MAG: DNA-directed RNA polymerase subunit N [Candidatus Helarchaeales archaeon]
MIIPIRCFTCGKLIAHKWEEYDRRVNKEGEPSDKVLDEMGFTRYCCRRMFVTHRDLMKEISAFSQYG